MTDTGSRGPLAGLLILDLTRVLAGPYCTLNLADLGARVIKVELPGSGDDARQIGPFMEPPIDPASAYFSSINRGKESIALNLKDQHDRSIFNELLSSADVLVENFTPGTMAKLGYSWEELHVRQPALIMASISGFGQSGPYSALPAYDIVVQAMGGILSLTGEKDRPPTRVGVSIGDLAAGLFGVVGIQAALIDRARTGLGRHVDVAMLDAQVALLENALARYQVEGQVPKPIGSRHPSITPFGAFNARDASLVIAAGNDAVFGRMCDALDLPGLPSDVRFSSNRARCQHEPQLRYTLEEKLAQKDILEWLEILRTHGIPCGPINDVAAVMEDEHLNARGVFLDVPLAPGYAMKMARTPVRLSGEARVRPSPPPRLDENREAILAEFIGRERRAYFLTPTPQHS
ncbi:CaiB/BaiF CoA-transferase family protein [Bradyrhizobium sp. 150]|uniref:CaiB/BaiF CoA transferase family protein n=1 Tax=Bradyrhizobium sp. 150 TaxID=2782625 RepID=UPI001FF96D3D|nr:CaiB/BaiF CoA-transferase family protein [Bradyrhizobium sp. 150]MCK1676776.1 CoA transferase [Bradyrhizobium sp. 150]